jgi:hypothetical protein
MRVTQLHYHSDETELIPPLAAASMAHTVYSTDSVIASRLRIE